MTHPDWHTLAKQAARERLDNELIAVEGLLWTRKAYYEALVEAGNAPHAANFIAYSEYSRATDKDRDMFHLWNAVCYFSDDETGELACLACWHTRLNAEERKNTFTEPFLREEWQTYINEVQKKYTLCDICKAPIQ